MGMGRKKDREKQQGVCLWLNDPEGILGGVGIKHFYPGLV
jgi:hypothetical protein